jgi:hypothetical protein
MIACLSSWTVVGWTWREEMPFCSISQACLIEFKSGDLAGQSMWIIVASTRYRFVMWALCTRALSSIRMKSGPTAPAYVRTWDFIDIPYCRQCTVFNDVLVRFLLSAYSLPHHDWTPAKTVVFGNTTHAGAKRSFELLQTLARLSVKSTQNLGSSVKMTGVKSLIVHVTRVCAHCKRSWIWRGTCPRYANCWPPWSQLSIMQPVSNSLCASTRTSCILEVVT